LLLYSEFCSSVRADLELFEEKKDFLSLIYLRAVTTLEEIRDEVINSPLKDLTMYQLLISIKNPTTAKEILGVIADFQIGNTQFSELFDYDSRKFRGLSSMVPVLKTPKKTFSDILKC
jgi:hypothetical protein